MKYLKVSFAQLEKLLTNAMIYNAENVAHYITVINKPNEHRDMSQGSNVTWEIFK